MLLFLWPVIINGFIIFIFRILVFVISSNSDLSFIKKTENIIIAGPTGNRLSSLFNGVPRSAYHSVQKLFAILRMSGANESYLIPIKQIEKHDLLNIDDFGMRPLSKYSHDAYEIIEDRQ